jgi:hypothetical protein
LGLSATPTESFRGKFAKSLRKGWVCGGKTGLTIQIQNGWRDFRFREKVSERQEIEKRFQAENQGFRGFRERKGVAKVGIVRLDSGLERETCTEERKET